MRRRYAIIFALALATTVQAQNRVPDVASGALLGHVWAVIKDSLSGGGKRAEELSFAADSLARAVIHAAGAAAQALNAAQDVMCPGSSDSTGAPLAGPVGYRVQVGLIARPDSASYVLAVSKSCRFLYRGERPRLNSGFSEGMSWEVTREGNAWRVGRRLSHVIT